jgi:hypothetical protein
MFPDTPLVDRGPACEKPHLQCENSPVPRREAVFRPELRQNKEIERFCVSVKR